MKPIPDQVYYFMNMMAYQKIVNVDKLSEEQAKGKLKGVYHIAKMIRSGIDPFIVDRDSNWGEHASNQEPVGADGRAHGEWILDKCACDHSRLEHLKPDGTGGGECRHAKCVAFIKGTVGSACHKFELSGTYNRDTDGWDPVGGTDD